MYATTNENMHFRMYVLLPKDRALTSEEAREYVSTGLLAGGFADQNRYNDAPADWFVIGGRWSGILAGNKEERNTYKELGFDDDAMIVTAKVYKNHLEEYEGKLEHDIIKDEYKRHWLLLDMEYEVKELTKEHIVGNYWIVVVDYHD